jgi:hypothetical protein
MINPRTSLYAIAVLALPVAARAQGMGGMPMDDPPGSAAHEAMAGKMTEGAHMRMTPMRPPTRADSARATAIADTLRRALAKYADPAVAERDGFRLFAPNVKNQKVFHYTKWANALGEAFRFNPAKPTSILYKRDATGHMKLVGAMYTMPKRASLADLDKRVPLSLAQWHLHTNLCAPKKGDERRYLELQNGKPLFGIGGSITTKDACDQANGRFTPVLFGWMVHANVFEGTDLKTVWGHDEH